jgi:signal transduction histidine kinase
MSSWPARLRTLPPVAVDVGLTVLALAAQAAPFLFTTRSGGGPWTVAEFAPILLVALPVLVRRRMPVTAVLVTAVGITGYSLLGGQGPEQPVWYGALVCMYAVADLSPRPLRLAVLACSALGIVVVGGVLGSVAAGVRESFLWGAAYALGRGAHVRRAYAAELEERAARLERERRTDAERAAERERARIARDMHDVLAHSVSLMVVQAEAGPVVVRSDPARAEAVFDAVAAAGRDALTQLRRMLGLLAGARGERTPQPTLDDVPALAAGVGRQVSLVTTGVPRAVPADVGTAAYRIVQEALTNVVKHAGGASAQVALDWRETELVVTVLDDGPGPVGRPVLDDAGGHGLIGITERAAACGGSAEFGPRGGAGGFRVSARLPA